MKAGIHPKYAEIDVTCSCGNTFKTSSTLANRHVEVCLIITPSIRETENRRYRRAGGEIPSEVRYEVRVDRSAGYERQLRLPFYWLPACQQAESLAIIQYQLLRG